MPGGGVCATTPPTRRAGRGAGTGGGRAAGGGARPGRRAPRAGARRGPQARPAPPSAAGAGPRRRRCASAALINFTKGLADLGGPSKILVTAVSPAATATERWDDMIKERSTATGRSVDDLQAEAAKAYTLGRIASPEDVADLVAFLVSA